MRATSIALSKPRYPHPQSKGSTQHSPSRASRHFGTHALRNFLASGLLAQGRPTREVTERLRHRLIDAVTPLAKRLSV